MQELQVMNIQMRIITEDNIDQLTSMNYKNTLKAVNLLGSNQLFITGNDPDQTQGFIKKFLMTKSFNINDLSRQINVYKNEGDFYEF